MTTAALARSMALARLPRPGTLADLARARLRPPRIAPVTVARALAPYGLELRGRIGNLPAGWRGRNVVVPTSGGRKVLKRYRDGWEVPAIEHEHSILSRLRDLRFPAVRLVDTQSGGTLVDLHEGRFALFDFETGANLAGYLLPPARRLHVWGSIGRLLAMFHRELEGFVPAGRHHLGIDGTSDRRTRDLTWHLDALDQLTRREPAATDPGASALDRWLRDRAGRASERLTELEARLADLELWRTVIHGDPGIHNVLIRADGSGVLHDLELARPELRLIDLVIVLSRAPARLARAFLAGYGEVDGSWHAESVHLPVVWEHYRLCGAVGSWWTFSRSGDPRRLSTARARILEAEQIAAGRASVWSGSG